MFDLQQLLLRKQEIHNIQLSLFDIVFNKKDAILIKSLFINDKLT